MGEFEEYESNVRKRIQTDVHAPLCIDLLCLFLHLPLSYFGFQIIMEEFAELINNYGKRPPGPAGPKLD